MEEVNAKRSIQKVHSEHPKQCKRQLYTLSEFWSIAEELGCDEKVSCRPCKSEGYPIKNPLCPYNLVSSVTNASHPLRFPHMQKDRMQLLNSSHAER
ncbi:hypothetical protein ACFX11_043923 [Malus domestica]